MAKLPLRFQFTDPTNLTPEEMMQQIERMYFDLATAINRKPDIFIREEDGNSNEYFLSVGDLNVNTDTSKVEMITDFPTQKTVTWTTLS